MPCSSVTAQPPLPFCCLPICCFKEGKAKEGISAPRCSVLGDTFHFSLCCRFESRAQSTGACARFCLWGKQCSAWFLQDSPKALAVLLCFLLRADRRESIFPRHSAPLAAQRHSWEMGPTLTTAGMHLGAAPQPQHCAAAPSSSGNEHPKRCGGLNY